MSYLNANNKNKIYAKPINENINEKVMLVIDENGNKIGELNKKEALKIADDKGLDLILLIPSNGKKVAVCKIGDFGKMLYQQKTNERKKRKNQSVIKTKEIKVRPQIAMNDLKWMVKNVSNWINDNNLVKFKIKASGRVGFKPQLINQTYENFLNLLGPIAKVQTPLKKISPIFYEATLVKNK